MKTNLRDELKKIIQQKHLSYADVGRKFSGKVSAQYISNILNEPDRTLTVTNAREFAQALDIDESTWMLDIAIEQIRKVAPDAAEVISATAASGLSTATRLSACLIKPSELPAKADIFLIENPEPGGTVPFAYLLCSAKSPQREGAICLLFEKRSRTLKVSKYFKALKQDYITYAITAALDHLCLEF